MECNSHDLKIYIENPPTPFVRSLIGELKNGTVIQIDGVMLEECTPVPGHCNSMTIDLRKSDLDWYKEHDPILLHIGVRDPHTNNVVLDSYERGGWQKPVACNGDFSSGGKFNIEIKVTSSGYLECKMRSNSITLQRTSILHAKTDKGSFHTVIMSRSLEKVTINGFSYPEFPHRLGMREVHAIEITGFISLNKVSIENLQKPCDFEKNTNENAGGVTNQVEMYRSKEPVLLALIQDSSCNCTIAGGMIDREIVLKGYAFATHKRFDVLLKEIKSNDIAFHFQVRFDQRKCVMNSFESEKWKKELEINHLPFQNNMDFTLKFLCDNTEIVIFHQDKELGRFCHRIPPYKINKLEISDGLKIHGLTLLTK